MTEPDEINLRMNLHSLPTFIDLFFFLRLHVASLRTMKIAPQFSISLLLYEQLASLIGLGTSGTAVTPPTAAWIHPLDYQAIFNKQPQ